MERKSESGNSNGGSPCCSSGEYKFTVNNSPGSSPNNSQPSRVFPRERPQGFEDGKLAQRSRVRCHWGCDEYLSTNKEAGNHRCDHRIQLYKDLLDMNIRAEYSPLPAYFDEINGKDNRPNIETDGFGLEQQKLTETMTDSPPETEAPSWNAIQDAFPEFEGPEVKSERWLEIWNSKFQEYPFSIGYYDLYWKN